MFELPAGVTVSGEILSEAKRELKEETGLEAKKWVNLGSFFVAPGHETTKAEVFLASQLYKNKVLVENQEGDEAIQKIIEVKVKDIHKIIQQGKIKCGITLASLILFLTKPKSTQDSKIR